MERLDRYFNDSYPSARQSFLDTCQLVGAVVMSRVHPLHGPSGETLAIDSVWIGANDASSVLVVTSGVHGVEGYAGSGVQLLLLADLYREDCLPVDSAILLIHAVNPWGMAWGYRENEDNVDLNRNFRDFIGPPPDNPGYVSLHDALTLQSLDRDERVRKDRAIERFASNHGEGALIQAIAGGQYTHSAGLYYGGLQPTWSSVNVRALLSEQLAGIRHVAVVDLHTGMGPFGYGSLISFDRPDSEAFSRQRRWFGRSVIAAAAGASNAPAVEGPLVAALAGMLPHAEVTAVGLEFGTLSASEDITRHREAMWLRHLGVRDSAEGRRILSASREHYFPASPDWLEMVAGRARMVFRQALIALSSQR